MKMTAVGFEPTPFRTSALSWRLRPLGHAVYGHHHMHVPHLQKNCGKKRQIRTGAIGVQLQVHSDAMADATFADEARLAVAVDTYRSENETVSQEGHTRVRTRDLLICSQPLYR